MVGGAAGAGVPPAGGWEGGTKRCGEPECCYALRQSGGWKADSATGGSAGNTEPVRPRHTATEDKV